MCVLYGDLLNAIIVIMCEKINILILFVMNHVDFTYSVHITQCNIRKCTIARKYKIHKYISFHSR